MWLPGRRSFQVLVQKELFGILKLLSATEVVQRCFAGLKKFLQKAFMGFYSGGFANRSFLGLR